MSWFPSSNIASLAKNALKEAQKTIDKALDINDEGSHGINTNTTVSSVTDAATDFFSSWGVGKSPSKNDPKQTESKVQVVTTAPTVVKSILNKNPSTTSLPTTNGDCSDVSVHMKRSFTATDIDCELMAPGYDGDSEPEPLISFEVEDKTCQKNNSSNVKSLDIHTENCSNETLEIPSSDTNSNHENSSKESIHTVKEKIELDPQTELFEGNEIQLLHNNTSQNKDQAILLDHDCELDSSSATVIAEQEDADANSIFKSNENPLGNLECEVEELPPSSKLSVSSRATSSISVISEEKDPSSPQISPTSAAHTIPPDSSGDSPSFEIIPINSNCHYQHPKLKLDSSFDFINSIQSGTSSVSIIPSLQSTPDRGTPLTHSRSNSNTSSSFDRIEEYNNRSSKCPSHHFISSTSSSDIEVIPLPLDLSLENLHMIQRKRKSVAEVEIQTIESWPETSTIQVVTPPKMDIIIAEKDSEISQLREEGEKLSKKQFELSGALKKLRQKEKDTDANVKSLKNDLANKNAEIEKLHRMLIAKESHDQSQSESISKLQGENRKLLGTISQLRSELEDAVENTQSMKSSLEDASIEILELQNTIASVQRDTSELDSLTKQNGELTVRLDSLTKEIKQLRQSLTNTQTNKTSRETELISKVHTLTSKIHTLENQLQDHSSEIADATMPLSLEVERLQQELKSKEAFFERREVGFHNKISELEIKFKNQIDAEKIFKSSQIILQNSYSELEVNNEKLLAEKSTLSYQLQAELNLKAEHLRKLSEFSTLESKVKELMTEIKIIRTENENLRIEIKTERNSLQAEVKRNQILSDQLKLINANMPPPMERVSFSSSTSTKHDEGSRTTSPRSLMSEASYLDDVLDPNGQNPCLTPKSFFDSFSSVNYIEGLQGHLRQKEYELVNLQEEVSKNEKIRKSLENEIANLTLNNEELLQRLDKLNNLQQKLTEVETNYNAVLQMYGEKVEEADELRLDLQDVKEMYKAQIEQLLKKS